MLCLGVFCSGFLFLFFVQLPKICLKRTHGKGGDCQTIYNCPSKRNTIVTLLLFGSIGCKEEQCTKLGCTPTPLNSGFIQVRQICQSGSHMGFKHHSQQDKAFNHMHREHRTALAWIWTRDLCAVRVKSQDQRIKFPYQRGLSGAFINK